MGEFSLFFQEIISFISIENILLMALAMFLGIVAGALPGLSATVGIALLTGITYSFSSDVAIIMMLGLYIGAIYAGSLTAILINIPGTGSAAATCLDGYELAKQGHANDAIMAARDCIVFRFDFRVDSFCSFNSAGSKVCSGIHISGIFLVKYFWNINLWFTYQ
jgi:TctA family transporter